MTLFYDLTSDAGEKTNLAAEYPDIVARLSAAHLANEQVIDQRPDKYVNVRNQAETHMPELNTPLHKEMFRQGKKKRTLWARLRRAYRALREGEGIYGLEWGDPECSPPLAYIRDQFLKPYIRSDSIVVEIGPGGGRWTRYMLQAHALYAVDLHQELLDELRATFDVPHMNYVKNNGTDFPGIAEPTVDFIFSFGTFVHLDLEVIDAYLKNMRPLLKTGSNVVVQYSDKTKPMGRNNPAFSDNDPQTMRKLINAHGYEIREEDLATLWHSSVVRFGLPQ